MAFIFKSDIETLITNGKLLYDGDLNQTKGLSVRRGGLWCVNLSAIQWNALEEVLLITELGKTIVHELMHIFIGETLQSEEYEGEEHICQIMAEQAPEVSFLS